MIIYLTFLYLRFFNTFLNVISYCFLNFIVRFIFLKLWLFCYGKVYFNSTSSVSNLLENISFLDIEEEVDIVEK